MLGDDKSQPTTKFFTGILIILMAVGGLVGLIRAGASDSMGPATTPSGIWWGLIALYGVFLLTGVVWVMTGIRALFLPTSLVYRMTDLPSVFERFTRSR
jgi:hypothetical protein